MNEKEKQKQKKYNPTEFTFQDCIFSMFTLYKWQIQILINIILKN